MRCDYLGRLLAKRLGKPYRSGLIKRIGTPRRQGGLSEEERRENVLGTFAVTARGERILPNYGGRGTVLVVDDILTTGSTLSACAETLKKAGVGRVWGVTLARTHRT